MRRRLAPLAGVLLASLTLAACGEKTDRLTPTSANSQSLSLMLDWVPNADHVGLYAALADGAFKAAGLTIHTEVPADPAEPLQLLQAGKVDLAVSYEPELMLARDKGAPLVAIGALVQRPLTSIVSLGSKHITSPAQLRGKTVGDAGIPYQHAYLETILKHAGVPTGSVKEVNVGENLVGAMLSKQVDATLGAYWNVEALQLQEAGKRPNVIHVENAGVPNYDELVLVTTENALAKKTSQLRGFVQALARGYQSTRADPQAAVSALTKANPSVNAKLAAAGVTATLPWFFPSGSGQPWGWMAPAQWTAYGQWMLRQHLISNPATIVGASTNQLLAGQGP
jgi:putative hydroxymethylpyrimidine transport system substrate-binding protein